MIANIHNAKFPKPNWVEELCDIACAVLLFSPFIALIIYNL